MISIADSGEREAEQGDSAISGPNTTDASSLTDEEERRYIEALETLPLLTRAVFLLSCRDDLPYVEIGWRCGICVEEVMVRVGDALFAIDRSMQHSPSIAGRIRRAVLPCRDAWAAARVREGDRWLSRWMPPQRRPGRRGALDWCAWSYERLFR